MIAQAFIAGVIMGLFVGFLIGEYIGYGTAIKDQNKIYKDISK
jgi:hypothetical protein